MVWSGSARITRERERMDIKGALNWARDELGASGPGPLWRDAEILLEAAAGKKRFELFIDPSAELTSDVREKYAGFVRKRGQRMPVDYILGRTEFMSLPFLVDEGVLIPRKETEVLVQRALEFLGAERKILDLGFGSGNIAVSAAFYSGCRVCALDISRRALEVARRNADLNGVSSRIDFFAGDLFTPARENGLEDFDMIISNPPYVKSGDMGRLSAETALFEPEIALCGGGDGLDFYRRIAKEAPAFLKEGGILFLEIGYDQAAAVSAILGEAGFCGRIFKDYSGINRVVEARLNGCDYNGAADAWEISDG